MTFEEKLYARRDDEMDDYGDAAYGDSLEDEEYEEEEEEEEEPESVSVVEVEVEEEPEVTDRNPRSRSACATQDRCQESGEEARGQESSGQKGGETSEESG